MLRLQHLPRKAVKTFPSVASEFALPQFKPVPSHFMHHRHGKHIISICFATAFLCAGRFAPSFLIGHTLCVLLLPCILTFPLLLSASSLAHVLVVILNIILFLPQVLGVRSFTGNNSWIVNHQSLFL